MGEKKVKGRKSLNRKIVLFCIFCWVVPIIIIFVSMTTSYKDNIEKKLVNIFIEKLRSTDVFLSNHLDEAIESIRKPSYEYYLEKAWNKYVSEGSSGRNDCYTTISSNLRNKFYWDKRFNVCSFYIEGEVEPFTYLSSSNISMKSYMEEIHGRVQEIRDMDSSYTQIIVDNGRVFIVRNVYTTNNYEKFGTLVLELNIKNIFEDISLDEGQSLAFCVNNPNAFVSNENFLEDESKKNIADEVLTQYSANDRNKIIIKNNNDYYGYFLEAKHDDYHLGILLTVDKIVVDAEMNYLYGMIFILLLITLPVLIIIIFFLRNQITAPIDKLVEAAKDIESGKLGVTVSGGDMPNKEFKYLQHSFNKMSRQVQYLFNYAYDEKLARKDAKILALQAQINPHFLNNTLEIMNFKYD